MNHTEQQAEETAERLPELKQIAGALLYASKTPLTARQIRRVLVETGEVRGGMFEQFTFATEKDVRAAIEALREELEQRSTGVQISEVAQGYRMQNDAVCGPWIRQMLDKNKTPRLSKPALETLAVIAYRQPVTRAEVEAVRGVSVDAMIRNLVEMQLVKAVGRSELPGRPWLFATTKKFLEHFGINAVDDLPGIDELKRMQPEPEAGADEEPALQEAEDQTAPLFDEDEVQGGAEPVEVTEPERKTAIAQEGAE
jgi:segregation and condensation protein B